MGPKRVELAHQLVPNARALDAARSRRRVNRITDLMSASGARLGHATHADKRPLLKEQPTFKICSNTPCKLGLEASCRSTGIAPIARGARRTCLERQPGLILRPVNDFERHAAPKHLHLKVGGMLFPIRRLPDSKPRCLTLCPLGVLRSKRATDAFVHHREAVVRECPIIHRARRYEKAAAELRSATAVTQYSDHQKVIVMLTLRS